MHRQLNGSKYAFGMSVALPRRIILSIFFLLSFSTFKYFPGMSFTAELWYIAIFLFCTSVYLVHLTRRRFNLTPLEVYSFTLITYLPIAAAYMSNQEFGQPMMYGFLSQRGLILAGTTMMFLYLYRRNFFSILDIERSLVGLSWFCLIVYSIIQLIFDPAQFAGKTPGFAAGGEVEAAKFAFDRSFIIFGFFYYVFAGYWQKSTRNILLALVFFGYLLVADSGRSLLLAVALSYLFFIWRWSTAVRFSKLMFKLSVVAGILLAILFVTNNEKFLHMYAKFSQATLVVLTGEEGTDASANARIYESAIAAPYIQKHWLLGNGAISNQWNEGYRSIFGYFYPADIGLIGLLFMYGVSGLLLFMVQFHFALRYSNFLPEDGGKWNRLVPAIKGFLLYYALHSVVTGRFANSVEIGLLFIAVLYCVVLFEQAEKLQVRK